MKFSDICIIITDVIKLRTFYEQVFETIADGDEVHSQLICGGLGIAIYNKSNAISDMGFNFDSAGTGLIRHEDGILSGCQPSEH